MVGNHGYDDKYINSISIDLTNNAYFGLLVPEKVVLASESLFRPANGVWSTRTLVEIHNRVLRLT